MTPEKRIEDGLKALKVIENRGYIKSCDCESCSNASKTLALFITIGKNLSEERILKLVRIWWLAMISSEEEDEAGKHLEPLVNAILSELVKEPYKDTFPKRVGEWEVQ